MHSRRNQRGLKATTHTSLAHNAPTGSDGGTVPQTLRIVWLHNDEYSTQDLIVNCHGWASLDKLRDTETFELIDPNGVAPSALLQGSTKIEKGRENLQVSVHRNVASRPPFSDIVRERQKVMLRLHVSPSETLPIDASLSHVELGFRESFMSRSDCWLLSQYLHEQAVRIEGRVHYDGYHLTVARLMDNSQQEVSSGYVTSTTKFTFTSSSCVAVWLFQLSREMWEFTSSGDLFLNRAIDGLIGDILAKWKTHKVHHILYLVLFAHTEKMADDFIDVVTIARDEKDYDRLQDTLRNACFKFLRILRGSNEIPRAAVIGSLFSLAKDGNTLQAVNLALNLFAQHQENRNLTHSGHMLVVITAGPALMRASYVLKQITAQRLSELGITCEMLCVSRPPLHVVPLIEYRGDDEGLLHDSRYCVEPGRAYYESPSFIQVHFYSRNRTPNHICTKEYTHRNMYELYTSEKWQRDLARNAEGCFIPNVTLPILNDTPALVPSKDTDQRRGSVQHKVGSPIDMEQFDADAILCEFGDAPVKTSSGTFPKTPLAPEPRRNSPRHQRSTSSRGVRGAFKRAIPFHRVVENPTAPYEKPSLGSYTPHGTPQESPFSLANYPSPLTLEGNSPTAHFSSTPPSYTSMPGFHHNSPFFSCSTQLEENAESGKGDVMPITYITQDDIRSGFLYILIQILEQSFVWNLDVIERDFDTFRKMFVNQKDSSPLPFMEDCKIMYISDRHTLKLRLGNKVPPTTDQINVLFNFSRDKYYIVPVLPMGEEPSSQLQLGLGHIPPTSLIMVVHAVEASVFRFCPVNPFAPIKHESTASRRMGEDVYDNSNAGFDARWGHVIPMAHNQADSEWMFLIRRTLFPLTTSQGLPFEVDKYDVRPNQVLKCDDFRMQLQEMILQRLIQSYQYVGTFSFTKAEHELSIGYQIQTIRITENGVVVTRYEHRGAYLQRLMSKEATTTFFCWNHRQGIWVKRQSTFRTTSGCEWDKSVRWAEVDGWIADAISGDFAAKIPYTLDPSFRARTLAFAILPHVTAKHNTAKELHNSLDEFFNSTFSQRFQVVGDSRNVWGHDYNDELDFFSQSLRKGNGPWGYLLGEGLEEISMCLRIMLDFPNRKGAPVEFRKSWFHFSISHCYNHNCWVVFRVYWLHCSGQHINEWVSAMKARGRQTGFQIVQIPFMTFESESDPFQHTAVFPLDPFDRMYNVNINPTNALREQGTNLFRRYLTFNLLENHTFYPETMVITEPVRFLHYTGSVMVQFVDNKALFNVNYLVRKADRVPSEELYGKVAVAVQSALQRVLLYIEHIFPITKFPKTVISSSSTVTATPCLRRVFLNATHLTTLTTHVMFVDCRTTDHECYIPDGVHLPASLFAPNQKLISWDAFCTLLEKHRITPDSGITIFYDEDGMGASNIAWWMAAACGYPEVYVLNGGYAMWQHVGCPLPPSISAKTFCVLRKIEHRSPSESSLPMVTDLKGSTCVIVAGDWGVRNTTQKVTAVRVHMGGFQLEAQPNAVRELLPFPQLCDHMSTVLSPLGPDFPVSRCVVASSTLGHACLLVALCQHLRYGLPALYLPKNS